MSNPQWGKSSLLWLFLTIFPMAVWADAVMVAAASSLRPLLERVLSPFSRDRGIPLRVTYGASGTLVQQMLRGAPYEIFLSAAPDDLVPLQQAGRVCAGPVIFAHGRLVLYIPEWSATALRSDLRSLEEKELRRLAIADPTNAPFGRLARQALKAAGVWQSLQGRLVYGESAAQAARLALAGVVDAALLPEHLVQEAVFAGRGRWVAVDGSLYTPTPLTVILLCAASGDGRAVFSHLRDHLEGRW